MLCSALLTRLRTRRPRKCCCKVITQRSGSSCGGAVDWTERLCAISNVPSDVLAGGVSIREADEAAVLYFVLCSLVKLRKTAVGAMWVRVGGLAKHINCSHWPFNNSINSKSQFLTVGFTPFTPNSAGFILILLLFDAYLLAANSSFLAARSLTVNMFWLTWCVCNEDISSRTSGSSCSYTPVAVLDCWAGHREVRM